jgi:hypothetical protein
MEKHNITLALPKDIMKRVKVMAVEQGFLSQRSWSVCYRSA